ncbi:PilZ domain-containing protein [Thiohalobacter sp. IOR34]|uniref:PilZ domain-containing protein n=1 Tax=Thiohalobacter sp. IOR34 TaxID=3057176 RepID=UPI0025B0DAF5|nr:PilZ domain-containing protein [Thiohalobacter sp. IOR34]WJW76237.1 PilZ domain-containing protein [Thiohalobacter sp. IOR34]
MAKILVKHYKSLSVGAREKTLVTELVTEDSETGRFLRKMEEKRIRRPCFETIDMRGKVPGECQRYLLDDRVFYLDDISYGIYQRGVNENGGVFTVGTYEAIVNGQHTNKAIREAELKARQVESPGSGYPGMRRSAPGEDGTEEATAEVASRRFNPQRVSLGYFHKRRAARLQYVTELRVEAEGHAFSGNSRDISVTGLRAQFKGVFGFQPGQRLQLSFPALQEQHPEIGLSDLAYEVVRSEQKGADHLLCLRLIEAQAPASFSPFIADLVERFKRKYRLDAEDDLLTVAAGWYERIHVANSGLLPLFLAGTPEAPRLQAVGSSDGNRHLLDFFRRPRGGHDLSSLALPHRLAPCARGQSVLIALYREKETDGLRVHSAADCEFERAEDFIRFLRLTLTHAGCRILKLMPGTLPFRAPDPRYLDLVTERLREHAEDEAQALQARIQALNALVLAVDVTDQVQAMIPATVEDSDLQQGLHCWVGHERRLLPGLEASESVDAALLEPELVPLAYVEQRREGRYLAETAVEVIVDGSRHKASTRDISTRGLAIRLDKALPLKAGSEIKVALVSLQKKRPSLNLMAVPYRAVGLERGRPVILRLERIRNRDEKKIDDFFVEVITKNKSKLTLDMRDTLNAAQARCFERIMVCNLPVIPFYIVREEEGGGCLHRVALPEASSPLAEFFRLPDGSHDFSWLSDSRLILALYQQIGKMARQAQAEHARPPHVELEVYCYKAVDPQSGECRLHTATELDFDSEGERELFLVEAAASGEFRFLKLLLSYSEELNRVELDNSLEPIRSQSRHRVARLQEQLLSIVGCGELIDVSDQLLARRALG